MRVGIVRDVKRLLPTKKRPRTTVFAPIIRRRISDLAKRITISRLAHLRSISPRLLSLAR